ncbi:abortive infection system antitoxin AbiGi family protein [Massilia sp. GCM10020059]|uniref:Abortive infection system antitoxin AbiGi family protein n=1 Tax=Massilia agrisoli TaxID=2892444 RepID=A0ABS8IX57_9BURK|nr:abortive infection system antitoxin AbiGi family protein [Massilia agrisoli]MCC6071800.1 abortive infection system antitoxin AbiGi family protein [Massilia agrisoli]
MNPKSSTLFHFTNNIDVIKSILKEGFWPRYSLEDVSQLTEGEYDYISFPMVCFCDIPLSRISDHVEFYGKYGIGMSRRWAEMNGLNPLLYLPGNNELRKELLNLNKHSNEVEGIERDEAKKTMRYIFAHSKPTRGTMVLKGEPVEKNFYFECEWRYVPKNENIDAYLLRTSHEKQEELSAANELTKKHCILKFEPSDIRYIFVERDSDIPGIMNYIQAELEHYSASTLKLLSSRVLSLEGLHEDL